MDPLAIIVNALAAGARPDASPAVREAGARLKSLLAVRAAAAPNADDLAAAISLIVKKPDDQGRRKVLQDEIQAAGLDQDAGVLELVAAVQASLAGDGAIAQGSGATAIGRGGVSVGGNATDSPILTGDHITYVGHADQVVASGKPSAARRLDPAIALDRYLGHVIASTRSLQLQGIRSAGGLVSIDLERIYITLTASVRRSAAAEEDWVRDKAGLAPGEAARLPERTASVVETNVKVQEALAAHPRLVVIGDPGCGKTTLLRYLALTFARDLAGEAGLVRERLQLDEGRLPILLPLRDFARHLQRDHADAGVDGPALLLDYLGEYFANQDIALPERFLADRLAQGECAVLLDGVDEVADVPARNRIARIVERFTVAYPGNRYVVTSRIVGYTGSARLGEGYAVTTVRDFTRADVELFVRHWNRAVEAALAGGESDYTQQLARKQSDRLLEALSGNERVRELAVNPLLLTVIALVQRYRAQLPERRTELYEEAVEVLLSKWDEAKGMQETASVVGRELDAGDRRSLLEPVALWMMERRAREIEADELRRQLRERFGTMFAEAHQAAKAVDAFLQLIGERSGLLQERGQGIYTFSHLTFQEHLAARAVSDRADYIDYTLQRLKGGWWRETILLEAGYLSTQGKQRATALVKAIMNCTIEVERYANLVLAAECLRDIGPARVEGDLWGEVQRRLRREFEQPLVQPKGKGKTRDKTSMADLIRRRAAAGEALGRIESGGSGMQPAFWRLPFGEPVWVMIPESPFWMGSDHGGDGEKPVHQAHLASYQIARVPITNAQYVLFVQATKREVPQHWQDGRPPRGQESHPVMNVSWHDALAYCRWLSEAVGKVIRLPSEAQWEKAARGEKDRREYPWGDEWDASRCNNRELGIGETTPVGIFPEGASPYGCLDMAGNVLEWTSSLNKPYPYVQSDGRENLEAGDDVSRVLRGGSFDDLQGSARCACRFRAVPRDHGRLDGFRVVVSPISPSALRHSAL
jgi:formylglycine-generating enzyme required for sulfatase activity